MYRTTLISAANVTIMPLLVAVLVLAPVTYTGEVQRAEALDIVHDPKNWIEEHLTALSSTISAKADAASLILQSKDDFKEYVLDPLAWALANTVLRSLTASIVNWINSGFQGSPAFVTDLQGFLIDVADEAAGEFIYGTELGALCSPFELDVRIALAIQYDNQKNYNPVCTLSDISDNIEGFINGSFTENGGWPAWFELTTNSVNHPIGAFTDAQAELSARIRNAQGQEITLLNWGDGFFSFEACQQVVDQETGDQIAKCSMTTPGSVIQDQLNESLSVGGRKLVVADEVDEIVSALMAQLAQQAITGAMGLLGLGGSSYSSHSFGASGDQTYLEAMVAESELANTNVEFETRISDTLGIFDEYIDLQFEIAERISSVATDLTQAQASSEIDQACFDLELPPDLERELRDASAKIETSSLVRAELVAIQANYTRDPNDDAARQQAIDDYSQLLRDGAVPTPVDLIEEEQFIENELTQEIEEFRTDLHQEEQRCRISNFDSNTESRGE